MSGTLTELPDGINQIALSFSGGGFRAAAFALGCASYLHATPYRDAPLLHKVHYISSTSGGSITNLVLAAFLRQGKTFEEAYRHLLEHLEGTALLDKAMAILSNEAEWRERPDKSRNLINAFAMAYDRYLLAGAEFGLLFQAPAHTGFFVREVCVNTTEFTNGANFRFANEGFIGNYFLKLSKRKVHLEAVSKLKLADILAASSCFPAGFEPIMFPRDFAWGAPGNGVSRQDLAAAVIQHNRYSNLPHQTVTDEKFGVQEGMAIPFMDGGIDDNQGIYAFIKADDRKDTSFDVYMPCDVTSNYVEDSFRYPAPPATPWLKKSLNDWLSVLTTVRAVYLLVTALAGVVGGGLLLLTPYRATGAFLLGMVALLVLLLILFMYARSFVLKRFAAQQPLGWVPFFQKYTAAFRTMPLHQLLNLLEARARSVFTLTTTIFLRKIRRMSYDYLFAEKARDACEALIDAHNVTLPNTAIAKGARWRDRIGMTAVFQLATKNDFKLMVEIKSEPWDELIATVSDSDLRLLKDVLVPSDTLRHYVDKAAAMETTLWFDLQHTERGQLAALVIAGQATMCFNLLRLSYRFASRSDGWVPLREKLVADWDRFQKEPDWLFTRYKAPA